MKNRTMPMREVAEAAALGIGGGIATGLAGPSMINNRRTTGTAGIGYQLYGEKGAVIGNIIGASIADKYNPSYAGYINKSYNPSYAGYINKSYNPSYAGYINS